MALLTFAAVTVVYMVALLVAASKTLQYKAADEAQNWYGMALKRAGKAYGVYAAYAFGVRFRHAVRAVEWIVSGVETLL